MKSNYKRLGDFIEEINIRNRDLEVDLLLGVSIRKVLMPSIANTIGSDMSKYKIISKNQFAYGPITSRNGDKISIALLEEYDKALLSQAYKVFQIKDTTQLLPEYLMMWFRRPEFDRYARYMSHGSTREAFDWQELCEVELPVPSIDKQQEIVADYNTVQERIRINEQLNTALEETAHALYKHWFVDFEFPIEYVSSSTITSSPLERTEERLGYKSSGGAMVYKEELDREIPVGWEVNKFDNYVKLSQGQVINAKTRYLVVDDGLPLLRITDLLNGTQSMFIDKDLVNQKNIAKKEDLIYSRTGQVGLIFRNKEGVVYNNCFKIIPINKDVTKDFLYWHFKENSVKQLMVELASGSAQSDLSHKTFYDVSVLMPSKFIQDQFSERVTAIENKIELNKIDILNLENLAKILLSKMVTVVDGKELVN